jgi:SAM-dependent methyltransferase
VHDVSGPVSVDDVGVESRDVSAEFRRRDAASRYRDLYSPFNSSHLFAVQCRERIVLRLLSEAGVDDLSNLRILEVGCGAGLELARLSAYGACRPSLFGIDLDHARAVRAGTCTVGSGVVQGDAAELPYRPSSFDLVLQFTVFSSIPTAEMRRKAADEILRVLRPGGHLIWHDFWLNPVNRRTQGLGRRAIRELFPGCRIRVRASTLAPPIARSLAGRSWLAASCLEAIPWLRTHYVALVTR